MPAAYKRSITQKRDERTLGFAVFHNPIGAFRRKADYKYVTSTHMTDKAALKVAINLVNQIGEIQKAANKKDRYAQVSNYNSMVIGVHNYYSMAVGYVKMRFPMKKAQIVNKYTVEGRTTIHEKLKMDLSIIRRLMENPVLNRTIRYADNRISRFIAQYGKCHVTNILLRYEDVHCHHKKLRSVGNDDGYGNLVIVHKDIHRLIHATDNETISKYLRKYGETINFSKLNKLRKAVGNNEVSNNVLDNPNSKCVTMESRVS